MLWLSFASAGARTTVSVNLDYAEGKYGERTKSTSWTMPLIVKQQIGDFGFKVNLPYIRATGTAASGGDASRLPGKLRKDLAIWSLRPRGDSWTTKARNLQSIWAPRPSSPWPTSARSADHRPQRLFAGGRSAQLRQPDRFCHPGADLGGPGRNHHRNPWFRGPSGSGRKLRPDLSLGAMVIIGKS